MKETPQQKYQRLVNEIQELVQEVDTIQVSETLKLGPNDPWLTRLARDGCRCHGEASVLCSNSTLKKRPLTNSCKIKQN